MARYIALPPRRMLAASLLLALAATACGGGDEGDKAAPDGDPTRITMKLLAYQPEKLTVARDTKVTWVQMDAGAHTVTSGVVKQESGGVRQQPDGLFDSGNVQKGATFAHTFAEPGTYTYYCALHPATMRGEVTVT